MGVADGDGEPAVVGPDDVQVEAHRAGDVQLGVLARVVRLVLLLHGLVMAVGSLSCPGVPDQQQEEENQEAGHHVGLEVASVSSLFQSHS